MRTKSHTRTIPNPKSCFLNLSYTSGSSPSRIERILTNYFENLGFEVKTGRMAPGGEQNYYGILRVIESCSFGITVYNEFRHNISYEWGIMDALGMPVIPFKDKNTHIDITKDFSDKTGITFVNYSGDTDEKDIIKNLENSDSLKTAIDSVDKKIAKAMSPEETDKVKEASRLLASSNIPLGDISVDKKRIIGNNAKILDAFDIEELTVIGLLFRANTYYSAGDLGNTVKELKRAIKIKPLYAEAHNNLGVLLSDLNRYEEAEEEYREAITINPDLVGAHNNLGALLKDSKRYEEAEEEYREAITINPDLAEPHHNLGVLLSDLKQYEEAEKELKEAIKIKPLYADAHNNLGALLTNLKRNYEAEKELKEAIKIKPLYAEAHNNLGVLLSDLNRYEEAEEEYREAITINPDLAIAHLNLGHLLRNSNRNHEVEKEYREAIKINPDYAGAHNNLGTVLVDSKRYEEAEKEYREAIKINPDLAEPHHNLGNLLICSNRNHEAEKEYREAIRINPDLTEAHHNLEIIYFKKMI